ACARKSDAGPPCGRLVDPEGRPRRRAWMYELSTKGFLQHAAVVSGYFPAVSEGNDVIVLDKDEPDAPERYRFTFPRQQRDKRLCLADFYRSRESVIENGEIGRAHV